MDNDELLSLLRSRFNRVKKANGNWYAIQCPTCSPKDARKMRRGVNFELMKTKCWICEEPMSVKDLLGRDIERPSSSPVTEDPEHPQARVIPSTGVIPINEMPKDHAAVRLFLKDHLNDLDRYWKDYEIGYITRQTAIDIVYKHEDRPDTKVSTANSLVFPVRYNGELIGWQLRYVPGSPKFRYFHIFRKGEALYNFDNAIKYKTVVVVEGVKKALKFPNGVCTFGKSISESQVQKLMNWNNIIFMYDGEDETQEKTRELVRQINVGSKKCICIDPRKYNYPSPDEMPEDVAQKIVYTEWINQTKNG